MSAARHPRSDVDAAPRAAVLTLNAGSSSIKFALLDAREPHAPILSGQIDGLGGATAFRARADGEPASREHVWPAGSGPSDHAQALRWILDWLEARPSRETILAVGHRVVHGGTAFDRPALIDGGVIDALRRLQPLAPLHQPHNLAGIEAAREAFGDVPQVACFDTAFHRGQPFVHESFALPRRYYDDGVRRYGFHGLSYEYIAAHLRRHHPALAAGRVVVAHLGNGASMCALHRGRSVATTMGFSALDGLTMGTRCGRIDPGVVLYLLEQRHMDLQSVSDLLYRESGLKGLSGISHDMRTLEIAEQAGVPDAALAIEHFVQRVRGEVGSLAAALGGIDALVFTGGIGENSVRVRERVLEGLGWLGFELDTERNREGATVLTSDQSAQPALRIATNEEGMIARHTMRLVQPEEVAS